MGGVRTEGHDRNAEGPVRKTRFAQAWNCSAGHHGVGKHCADTRGRCPKTSLQRPRRLLRLFVSAAGPVGLTPSHKTDS